MIMIMITATEEKEVMTIGSTNMMLGAPWRKGVDTAPVKILSADDTLGTLPRKDKEASTADILIIRIQALLRER